jgi:hypothetical protein
MEGKGMMHTDKDIAKMDGQKGTLTTTDMTDRTASYTIPQMASNNVVINITGGCEYCKAGQYLIVSRGFTFEGYCGIDGVGKLFITYGTRIPPSTNTDPHMVGSRSIKINYCPMCGRKLEVEK